MSSAATRARAEEAAQHEERIAALERRLKALGEIVTVLVGACKDRQALEDVLAVGERLADAKAR